MAGLEIYNQPQYATPYAPRTGPGGYPSSGYATTQTGYGGFGYTPITGNAAPQGLPAGLQGSSGFAGAADTILAGSSAAEGELRQAYEAMFRHRAGGIVQGFGEMQSRVGAEHAAQGESEGAIRRNLLATAPQAIGQIGMARAEADSGFHFDNAKLAKGTAGELTSLKLNEINTILNAYFTRKGAKQAQKNSYLSFAGDAAGAAAYAFGGPVAGAATNAAIDNSGGIY